MKTKLLLLVLLFVQLAFSQQRTCGMEEKMQRDMSNPVLKLQYLEREAKFEIEYQKLLNENSNNLVNRLAPIIIPVAVHYPEVPVTASQDEKDCLIALAQSQIDVINADYNAANSDLSIWTSGVNNTYPGVNVGNMGVSFQIAKQNHPAGTNLSDGMVSVTFGTNFLERADSDATWAGYMNFVVRDAGSGILGYSPLRGSPSAGQTVVMNKFCFGTGDGCSISGYVPNPSFNLGRTVTHELGHFFNLNHTFNGCTTTSNCASSGDKVCDTPASSAATYGCPSPGSVLKCNGIKVLTMNYMDYVNDPCMYLFTAGQTTRMLAYYNSIQSQYKPNVLLSVDSLAYNGFDIYPNPIKNNFNVDLKEPALDLKLNIVDISGRTIFNKQYSNVLNIQIDNINATTGIYFVSINADGKTFTKKVIVE